MRLIGDYFDQSLKAAQAYAAEHGGHFLSPFDDADVIEGQASIAVEIEEQLGGAADFVILPVGGGGMSSGVAQYFGDRTYPLFVEPKGGACLRAALAAGHPAVNTYDRLDHAAERGEISTQRVRDLREALAFLGGVRLRHQAKLMAAGHDADNHLRPDSLSNFEREQLKTASDFGKPLQDVLAQRSRNAG